MRCYRLSSLRSSATASAPLPVRATVAGRSIPFYSSGASSSLRTKSTTSPTASSDSAPTTPNDRGRPRKPLTIPTRRAPSASTRRTAEAIVLPQVVPTPFRYGDGEFASVFEEGSFCVDKTAFIPVLEGLKAKAVVSLRPRRFGKTLWLDTLVHYYDMANKGKRFSKLFGHLAIGAQPTALASTFHVLRLSFAGLKTDNVDKFESDLNDKLNTAMKKFKLRYEHVHFDINENNALTTFESLAGAIEVEGKKLYVFIDEYDAIVNRALGVLEQLRFDKAERSQLSRMESIYSGFFSRVKEACDKGARCFVTGVTPLALAEFTSVFNIARHITSDLDFALLYGFTEADVRKGLERLPDLKIRPDMVEHIMASWKRDHDGYHFNPHMTEALYNPTRVLHGLGELEQNLRNWRSLQLEREEGTEAAERLLRFSTPDSNSKPAESTLEIIKGSTRAASVVARALSATNGKLECPGGVSAIFRLSEMHELATSDQLLISFMFHTGALTYDTSGAPGAGQESLRIPTEVARTEFAFELQKMLGLEQTGREELHEAMTALLIEKEIQPLCDAFSRLILSRHDGRDAIGGEDAFASSLFAAMVCAQRPGDRLFKEYGVSPASKDFKQKKRRVDITCVQQHPTMARVHALTT